MTNATEQVVGMTDLELVAFWNVLVFADRLGSSEGWKKVLVSETLTSRGIAHEHGKRITSKAEAAKLVAATKLARNYRVK